MITKIKHVKGLKTFHWRGVDVELKPRKGKYLLINMNKIFPTDGIFRKQKRGGVFLLYDTGDKRGQRCPILVIPRVGFVAFEEFVETLRAYIAGFDDLSAAERAARTRK